MEQLHDMSAIPTHGHISAYDVVKNNQRAYN